MLVHFISLSGFLAIAAILGVALWVPISRSRLEEEARVWPTTEATGVTPESETVKQDTLCRDWGWLANGCIEKTVC